MKNNMLTIIKKELARFFGDKRMVLTTVLLPGLMIYALYSFMGDGMMSQFTTADDYEFNVYVENMPQSVESVMNIMKEEDEIHLLDAKTLSADELKEKIENKEADMYMVFPKNFESDIAAYDPQTASKTAPLVEIYYNSTKTESAGLYQFMSAVLDTYESSMANKFDINSGEGVYDLASKEDVTGQVFSMMLPMLLMIFMFSGCMAIAPESIAGEKERGTIATLLVTPMKRSHLAIGKIISLSFIGLLGGLSSFLGTILSLPKLMGAAADAMDVRVYKAADYALLLCVVLTTVLLFVAVLSVISAFAKSVKEASTLIMPIMILVMVVGITSMMGSGAPAEPYWYLIPVYNSVQCMNGIFGFSYDMVNIIITLVVNVIYTLLLTGVLSKMFGSEKMMYS